MIKKHYVQIYDIVYVCVGRFNRKGRNIDIVKVVIIIIKSIFKEWKGIFFFANLYINIYTRAEVIKQYLKGSAHNFSRFS